LTADKERFGYINGILEAFVNSLGDGCFPVARRAIQEDPSARIDCRPQRVKDLGFEHQVLECILQFFRSRALLLDGLTVDALQIIGVGNRSCTNIGSGFSGDNGFCSTLFGEHICKIVDTGIGFVYQKELLF